jgi:hypothetical protein
MKRVRSDTLGHAIYHLVFDRATSKRIRRSRWVKELLTEYKNLDLLDDGPVREATDATS